MFTYMLLTICNKLYRTTCTYCITIYYVNYTMSTTNLVNYYVSNLITMLLTQLTTMLTTNLDKHGYLINT